MPVRSLPVPVAVLVLALAASPCAAQAPYKDEARAPRTPAETRAQEILDAVNSGEAARLRRLVEEAYAPALRDEAPLDHHLSILSSFHQQSGRLAPHGFRTYDPPRPGTAAVLVVKNELLDTWQAVTVDVQPAPPHLIAGLGLAPARTPSDLPPPPPLSQDEMLAAVRAHVDRLVAADAFSGTVSIAKDGEALLELARGEADRGLHAKNDLDTRFNLGSMNKMFTAVAILQLAEQGKLSLDDTLDKWLGGDWIARKHAERIRLRHLLTHSSGLGSYFTPEWERSSRALYRTLEDWKPVVKDETPAFDPGTDWAYSNTGFLLLGAVIEKVTGADYHAAIRERVTGPAGMTRTDCYELDRPIRNLAVGYSRAQPTPESDGQPWRSNVFEHVLKGGPAGGGYSTARDLQAFAKALVGDRLLKPATRAEAWSPRPELHSPGYGYGFQIDPTAGGLVVGHSGGFNGISSQLDVYPGSGWTVVVLSNQDGGAQAVTSKTRELIGRLR